MSIIKSFSVGNGDMYYIKHNSDNFTVIDCCLTSENKDGIINEIITESQGKEIKRFISTHPDDDHICGLFDLNEKWPIINFYSVKNEATKDNADEDFNKYCELRDSEKAYYIEKGCSRRWMNMSTEERGSSGIYILWPDPDNEHYKDALTKSKEGNSPNNISPIVKYSIENGVKALWLGDLESDFMEKITDEVEWPSIDILFAPHHGRDSGKIPENILKVLNPKIVIIGEAPSEHLNYYQGYNTITQNSAGDITFECLTNKVHVYVSSSTYTVDFLEQESANSFSNYIGTLKL